MMEQYSIIHTAINQFIQNFLDEDGIIKLIPDDDVLMPCINKKTFEIKYSYRTEILVLLQNCNLESIMLDYYFASTCYLNNDFEDSRFFISRIREKIKIESSKIKECYPSVKAKIVYQMLFMVLHEIAHGVFGNSDDLKDFFYNLVEEEVTNMVQMYSGMADNPESKELMDGIKKKHYEAVHRVDIPSSEVDSILSQQNIIQNLGAFPEYISDNRKKEELACDLYALRMFQHAMSQHNVPEKNYLDYYSASLNGIQFLSRYMWWDCYLIRQMDSEKYHKKTYLDPLRSSFFFTECVYGREEYSSDIEDYMYEKGINGVPFLGSCYEVEYVRDLYDKLEHIGEGVINYKEEEKKETNELLLGAENDILSCVMNI